jgi:hypothetical protein
MRYSPVKHLIQRYNQHGILYDDLDHSSTCAWIAHQIKTSYIAAGLDTGVDTG